MLVDLGIVRRYDSWSLPVVTSFYFAGKTTCHCKCHLSFLQSHHHSISIFMYRCKSLITYISSNREVDLDLDVSMQLCRYFIASLPL